MPDGTVTIKIKVDGKEVEAELQEVNRQVDQTAENASDASEASQRDAKALGLALGAITTSLVAAGLKAYEFSSQFQAAFAKTQTIMDTNVMAVGDMRSAVLELSRDSAMAAGDVSDAVYQAISGSVDTADAVQFVDKANQLAVAGFTSLTNATDVLTTTLNAYHLSAEKVEGISNVLIRTQNLGKTSVDELSASMGKAIATGSAYGVDLENLSTAYVELTRNGIATAESTTYINSMLNELGDSSKTVGKIILEQTGKSFGQLMADGKSLGDVLQILMDSVDGNAEALMGLWGSQEAGKAANAIVSQSIEDFNKVLSQMNSEMAGATGTTAQAYETMTSTSEFIDRRLNNSVKNLAIAYGDILAPPMDAIKSLGADILEGLTDLIQRSPAAASAIAAVSTGVVVLAGGLAALMIVQKVKEAFGGFNALLASNPAIIAAAGIAALVVGIVSLVGATQEENKYLAEFSKNLDGMKGSLEHSLAAADVASDQVQNYVARLRELESTGLKTTEQQEEYHAILEKLVETVPELAKIIDLETDSIEGGTDAILANTEAWVANEKTKAYQAYMAELEEARTNALIDQEVAQRKLTKATEEYQPAIDAYLEAQNAAVMANDDAEGSMFGAYTSLSELRTAYEEASEKINEAQTAMDSAAQAAEIASSEYEIAKEAVEGLASAEAEAGTAAEEAGTEIEDAGNKIAEVGPKISDVKEKVVELKSKTPEITDAIQAWTDKYGDLYRAAKESLEKQFKLWEEAEQVTSVSVKEANRGIQSQIDYWHQYNDDLNTIKDSGIAGMELLYQHISDGSTDSVAMASGIAEAIRSGNEPAVEEMVELYKGLAEAQGETADSMMAMQTDMDKALEELLGSVDAAVDGMEMPDDAWAAAHNTVLAYARGLYSGQTSVVTAAHSVANAAASALKSSGGHSGGPKAYAYASGTDYAASGLALVGEEGPELVYLRGGERILTAAETQAALSGLYDVPATGSYTGRAAPASVGGGPGGSREMTIVVPVEIDGREIARATAQTMGEEMMFGGY
ncbi:MAG: phage tail tape measure protein [Oscillospiraceae bacterium]|nr:phage tail tape measure protein [Oscillospiraceae bacterium]MBR4654992.1 phage tail tape measure protein [Oscillospiraceae bacterium]